jgi:hypothetical protein
MVSDTIRRWAAILTTLMTFLNIIRVQGKNSLDSSFSRASVLQIILKLIGKFPFQSRNYVSCSLMVNIRIVVDCNQQPIMSFVRKSSVQHTISCFHIRQRSVQCYSQMKHCSRVF